jgi:mono/diheme cytochrome c family protein
MMKKLIYAMFTAGMFAWSPVLAQDSPQIVQGKALFAEHCALCHGADGRQGQGFQTPIWGAQTQISKFGNALGLFEYNQMMMPFQDPTLLNDDQKLAIIAYILANHGAISRATEVTPATIAGIPIR